ncbi:MAG: hypothetical protein QXE96_04140 [Candidatus Caldarchaeum sp.]
MAENSVGDKRIKKLEEEIRRIREPLEKTLLEIREMMNMAENPFIYLKGGDLGEVSSEEVRPKQSADKHAVENNLAIHEKAADKELHGLRQGFNGLDSFITTLAAVDLMVVIVGRENLVNLVNMLAWRNLIPRTLLEGIKEALEFISTLEKDTRIEQAPTHPPGFNDLLIVLYMLSLLVKDRENPITFLLLSSAGNLKFLSRNWGGRQV